MRDAAGMHPPRSLSSGEAQVGGGGGGNALDFDLVAQCVAAAPDFRGVRVIPEFCSDEEARALLANIEQGRFVAAQSGKAKQHFGPKVNFKRKKLSAAGFSGFPEYVGWILRRLEERGVCGSAGSSRPPGAPWILDGFDVTDVFVLRYRGELRSNLDLHIDDQFAYGDGILGLSLESDSVLTFVEGVDAQNQAAARVVRVPLPARSALVLQGPARHTWQHGILADDISGQRTSITLRTLSSALRTTSEGQRVLAIAQACQLSR